MLNTDRSQKTEKGSEWSTRYFWQGLRTGLPIALGYFPTAMAFGVVALAAGLTEKQAFLVSIVVFSGAGQFMAINLMGSGAAPISIIIANLVINLRYTVMSASLARRLRLSWGQALYVGFGVTDETFVMNYLADPKAIDDGQGNPATQGTEHHEILPTSFVLGVNVVSYLGWVLGTSAGVVFAGVLPSRITAGMGVVLYAMFIALLVPSVARSLRIGCVAVASGIVCWLLGLVLPVGWAMILATSAIAGIGVLIWGEGVDSL